MLNVSRMQSMFYQDGELIPEPEYDPRQVSNWVNVFLQASDHEFDDETIMRTVSMKIHNGAGTISSLPEHHNRALCVSIKAPGEYNSDKASIFAAAELQSDFYRQEIRTGRVRINRELLFRRDD
ncbi:unnamed protein product [Penicillium olsonii]|uniref:Uncharacterized protein n=1 Tax=Penicillium olsonii TaxID=99116 RepID=A0A9W4MZ28_PENOL|nr:unnamed protein product [Penicillium olsonii]CAG8175381.1 unnamed protein product [Penicillium olsonii]